MSTKTKLAKISEKSKNFVKDKIDELNVRPPRGSHPISDYYNSPEGYQDYVAPIIGTKEWYQFHFSHPFDKIIVYFQSLFPILSWISRYNIKWLYGDLIAGITLGCVAVPQAMSYAKIATLPTQYGLYSTFIGVFIYCFFATSKDVCIGPVAVMSLEVSKVIARVLEKDPNVSKPLIATTLTLMCGVIATGLGIFRLGFILEFIPLPTVAGFMSGSALNILVGQVPSLFGISSLLNTRDSTYKVVINTLKHLHSAKLDAAWGLVSLLVLYLAKYTCAYGKKKYPRFEKVFFFGTIMRSVVVIIFATLFAWLNCRHESPSKYSLSLIKTVPSGFREVGTFKVDTHVLELVGPELPVSVIVLLLEHISISKSFGRVNDYKISPDQEVLAIGVSNLIGVAFNAYPATGSFSRSALKAKCGVRTPLSGIFTGSVVILALYCLTDAFFWIPNAALSAIIIHAVADLIAPPQQLITFWKIAPVDAGIFVVCIFITVFSTIENGIYFAICAACAQVLWRIAKPHGDFLGRVTISELVTKVEHKNHISDDDVNESDSTRKHVLDKFTGNVPKSEQYDTRIPAEQIITDVAENNELSRVIPPSSSGTSSFVEEEEDYDKNVSKIHTFSDYSSNENDSTDDNIKIKATASRTVWVPLSARNSNPLVVVEDPPAGVLVYRPNENFTYINCSRHNNAIIDEVKKRTRRGARNVYKSLGDRPWNDPGPRNMKKYASWTGSSNNTKFNPDGSDARPLLRALIFDFSCVTGIDSTAIQMLIDTKKQADKYAGREVEFHFAGILSPWIRRALIAGGFGRGTPSSTFAEIAPVYHDSGLKGPERHLENNGDPDKYIKRFTSFFSWRSNKNKDSKTSDDIDNDINNEINDAYKKKELDGVDSGVVNQILGAANAKKWAADDEKEERNILNNPPPLDPESGLPSNYYLSRNLLVGPILSSDTPFFHLEIPDLV